MRTKNRIRQCEEGRIWWERFGFKSVKAGTGDAICPQNLNEIGFANDRSARGPIVCEPDLIEVLRADRIAGAGLDGFETEPLPPDSPFFALPNTVLSPHSAGITPEATEAGLALAVENVFAWLAGRPTNVVV